MHKNFGVKIHNGYGHLVSWEVVFAKGIDGLDKDRPFKYCIHEDSLSIFKPQEGDILIEKSGTNTVNVDRFVLEKLDYWKNNYKIIQRNGEPFIAPQQDKGDM
jgi:hypothetical protein